jgi:hypothetical protein
MDSGHLQFPLETPMYLIMVLCFITFCYLVVSRDAECFSPGRLWCLSSEEINGHNGVVSSSSSSDQTLTPSLVPEALQTPGQRNLRANPRLYVYHPPTLLTISSSSIIFSQSTPPGAFVRFWYNTVPVLEASKLMGFPVPTLGTLCRRQQRRRQVSDYSMNDILPHSHTLDSGSQDE